MFRSIRLARGQPAAVRAEAFRTRAARRVKRVDKFPARTDGGRRRAPELISAARDVRREVTMKIKFGWRAILLAAAGVATVYAGGRAVAGWPPPSFLNALRDAPAVSVSTSPPLGTTTEGDDQNPYGVAVVPIDAGKLKRGHILVSNFNDATNDQGTGSTIVDVDPRAQTMTTFFDSQGTSVGLSTALLVLRSGFVVVGSAPRDSTVDPPSVQPGALVFLDANANEVLTLEDSALIAGPWDATADEADVDRPKLFVSNVLDGTVVRINAVVRAHKLSIESITRIGSGFAFRTDTNALVVGPTGLAWDDERDELFIADTGNNRIAELDHVSRATRDLGSGDTVFSGAPLQGPLGLVLTPSRHLVTVNGDAQPSGTPNNLAVEVTRSGELLATRQLDSGAAGALFGVTLTVFEHELSLVFVDDNDATVKIQKTR
jgi:hypothetical protein